MDYSEASIIIEDVLDTLIEVGNGTTQEHLKEACTKLFKFRDEFFGQLEESCFEDFLRLMDAKIIATCHPSRARADGYYVEKKKFKKKWFGGE